ncbi:hypothetical protein FQZ97_1245280 [compost metagenome]
MVTSEPSRRQTEPISSPITPEPISTIFLGTAPRRSAPSLESTTSSSNGVPGKARALEPVATMIWRAVSSSSFAPVTWIS